MERSPAILTSMRMITFCEKRGTHQYKEKQGKLNAEKDS